MIKLLIGILIGSLLKGAVSNYSLNREVELDTKDESLEDMLHNKESILKDSFILTGDLIKEIDGQEAIEISASHFIQNKISENVILEDSTLDIKIYSEEGILITKGGTGKPIEFPLKGFSGVVSLDSERMGIGLTYSTGFHHTQTEFFSILKEADNYDIVSIYKDKPDKYYFYNTRGELVVHDLDDDGVLEVAEIHDEYLPEGGRGKAALRAVYKYDSDQNLFLEMKGKDYEKFYEIISGDYSEPLIRASESRGKFYENFPDYLEGIAEHWKDTEYIRGE